MRLTTKLRSYIDLPDRSFTRNFLTLLSGTTLAQAIPFFVGPIISRLYAPADIGFFVLLSSTAGILSILSTGTYEYGVLVEERDDDSHALKETAIVLSLIFSTLAFVALLVIFIVANHTSQDGISWLWLLVPLQVFLTGTANIQNYYLNRHNNYPRISSGKVVRTSGMSIFQIGIGFIKWSWGLFLGQVLGQLVTVFYLLKGSHLNLRSVFKHRSSIIKQIVKFKKYPLLTMPGALINELSIQVPIYILQLFFTASVVGFYALPHKFLNAPIMLIGSAIGQVFFQRAAKKHNSGERITDTALSVYWFLFKVGLIPFSIIMVFGDILFAWYFGETWRISGMYAQMLSPWLFFVLCGSPLSNLFVVFGKLRLSLNLNIGLLLLRISAMFIGAFWFSPTVAILLFAAVSFVYWLILTFYTLYLSGAKTAIIAGKSFSMLTGLILLLVALRFIITKA